MRLFSALVLASLGWLASACTITHKTDGDPVDTTGDAGDGDGDGDRDSAASDASDDAAPDADAVVEEDAPDAAPDADLASDEDAGDDPEPMVAIPCDEQIEES